MYTFDSRIRYSETDSEGKLTIMSLLNYFQDASTFHSEDLGVGMGYLREQHLVWVLNAWQIVVHRMPEIGERVTVGTLPYEFKGFLGMRNFIMLDEQGETLAAANSVWSLLSTDSLRPARLTEQMIRRYVPEEKLPMDYAPRKIAIPEGLMKQEPIVVKKHHLDTNHHVNNGQYVNMALQYLPEDLEILQMRAEYKKQAFLDDVIVPGVVIDNKQCVVELSTEDGHPYATVEFLCR